MKGKLSEFYVFLKLLSDGILYAADSDLNPKEDLIYRIIKILRSERSQNFDYIRNDILTIQSESGEILSRIPYNILFDYSQIILNGIKNPNSEGRSFSIDNTSIIFEKMLTNQLSDDKKSKADVRIVVHDPHFLEEKLYGFSIKSYLGGKPTLFNASKKSNIIYKIKPDIDLERIMSLNATGTYTNRMQWLNENGYTLQFHRMKDVVFSTNLELIDSRMPEIIGNLILDKFVSKESNLNVLLDKLSVFNPCNFNLEVNELFYRYKLKRLLVDIALGMTPAKIWDGIQNATGGFIVVKRDGSLVCFHVYNFNQFQDYLINHTKIDAPDSNPHRCDYGRILSANEINEPEGTFIQLNFQIRFT